MNNTFDAFASNPRYTEGGLDEAIYKEDLSNAKKRDTEAMSLAKLEAIKPMEVKKTEAAINPIESDSAEQAPDVPAFDSEKQSAIAMHDNILGALDVVTGPARDITAGMIKAVDNTIALAVGRENMDAGNEWLKENIPGMEEISKGLEPRGTFSAVTQEMSQFMIPFGLYMKGVGGLAAASNIQAGIVSRSIIADIITSGSALDPHVERFAGLMKELGADNLFNDWLADNENETESEGRLKNILDSGVAGGVVSAGFIGAALTLKGLWRTGKAIKNAPMSVTSGTRNSQRGSVGVKPGDVTIDSITNDLSKVGIDASLSESDRMIRLSKIIVDPAKRNIGKGSKALKNITDYADEKGKMVTLTPSKDFGATSTKRLTDFYKRAGFVENKGRNKDYEISDAMYRLPNANEVAAELPVDSRMKPGNLKELFNGDTNEVARARFDIQNLEKISRGGSDRQVFDLGENKVLKVTKTARGLAQNDAERDGYLTGGILPQVYESGQNYNVTELVDFKSKRKEINQLTKFLQSQNVFSSHGKDQGKIYNVLVEAQEKFNIEGLEDLGNYDLMWGDITASRNWGVGVDGRIVHADGGSINEGVLKVTDMDRREWDAIKAEIKKIKKEKGDVDKYIASLGGTAIIGNEIRQNEDAK